MRSIALAALGIAITNGAIDEGHRAVGAIYEGDAFLCSATLVGARSVLTAAHCLSSGASGYRFVVEGESFAVAATVAHPDYDPGTGLADVGIVLLEDAPGIAPLPLSIDEPEVGGSIAIVGLGCTRAPAKKCELGTRRVAPATIAEVTPDEIVFASSGDAGGHCDGDSGGPLLVATGVGDAIAGVHAWGPTTCIGENRDARVDRQLGWIRAATNDDVAIVPPAKRVRGGCR